ncbi:hypothetical protein VPH35_011754 [Triticum aestivum]
MGNQMPLPFVYEAFPEKLRQIGSVPSEMLEATRARRWRERAMQIRDDAMSWMHCVREWKEMEEAMAAAMVSDPEWSSHWRRRVQTYKNQADQEMVNFARRIYFEATYLERARMPSPSAPPVDFANWAKVEAQSGDPMRSERWECLVGLMPTSVPALLAPRDGSAWWDSGERNDDIALVSVEKVLMMI